MEGPQIVDSTPTSTLPAPNPTIGSGTSTEAKLLTETTPAADPVVPPLVGPYTKLFTAAEHSKIPAVPITQQDWAELPSVIAQMKAVIVRHRGIALAGPQVGYNKQLLVVLDTSGDPKNVNPWDICVNPTWKPVTKFDTELGEEGCLTFPGTLFEVSRWRVIEFKWQTPHIGEDGQIKQMVPQGQGELVGAWSRIAQHECDHLEGKTLADTGKEIDQKEMLRSMAKSAGFSYDEVKGALLTKDPKTGQMVEVDHNEAINRIVAVRHASRQKEIIRQERTLRREATALQRRKIKERRRKEKLNKKKSRR